MTRPQRLALAVIIFALLLSTLYVLADRFYVLRHGELQQAQIIACESKYVHHSKGNYTAYYPVAVSAQGAGARASFGTEGEACSRAIGRALSIYALAEDPANNRINNFAYFWGLPSLLLGACLCVALAWSASTRRLSQRITLVGGSVMLMLFFWDTDIVGLRSQLQTLQPSSSNELLSDEQRSARALQDCVQRQMQQDGVAERTDLQELVCGERRISDLSSIADLKQLHTLALYSNELQDLRSLAALPLLQELNIANNKTLQSLRGVERLGALRELHANDGALENVSALADLLQLQILSLSDNRLSDIAPLRDLNRLQELRLDRNQISDISPLSAKPELKFFTAYYNPLLSVAALQDNRALTVVGVDSAHVPCAEFVVLRQHLSVAAKIYPPEHCASEFQAGK